MKIFDLHTHVLPGVDDGAANMEEALQMLRNAAASDVRCLGVTPHCNVPGCFDNYASESLAEAFVRLQRAAQQIPVQLIPGAEVHVTEQLPALLQQGRIPTLNSSRYLLTEFSFRVSRESSLAMLRNILAQGYVPVVAHPERLGAVCEDPRIVEDWLRLGCHIQLTGGSILGKFGIQSAHCAQFLLQNVLVACVASDAHGCRMRTNYLADVYSHLELHYSGQYAHALMWENPLRICKNETI